MQRKVFGEDGSWTSPLSLSLSPHQLRRPILILQIREMAGVQLDIRSYVNYNSCAPRLKEVLELVLYEKRAGRTLPGFSLTQEQEIQRMLRLQQAKELLRYISPSASVSNHLNEAP